MRPSLPDLNAHALVERLEAQNRWPSGLRIPGQYFHRTMPWWSPDDVVLYSSTEIRDESLQDWRSLRRSALRDAPGRLFSFRIKFGSLEDGSIDLPWIDFEQVVPIGEGADFGVDLWLLADYRLDRHSPRVVANEVREVVRDSGQVGFDFQWRVVAFSLEAFAASLLSFEPNQARPFTGPEVL